MKRITTNGISGIDPVPGAAAEWYFGVGSLQGDLYEAEEIFLAGYKVKGNSLCLIHYPDGEVFRPMPDEAGVCFGSPVYMDGRICILKVDFNKSRIGIFGFDCCDHEVSLIEDLPLASVKNCYNLMLHIFPLCLTRQGNEGLFEIIWPESVSFKMDPHESFFLRENERLYFSKWHEEGDGPTYRYWEETVVRDLEGTIIETLPGDVRLMPDGELWHLA